MWNSQRHTRTPTSAISPATTAVATPPDHNWRASTLGRPRRCGGYWGCSCGYGRLSGVSGDIGTVMVYQAFLRLAAPYAAFMLSSPPDRVPNTGARAEAAFWAGRPWVRARRG